MIWNLLFWLGLVFSLGIGIVYFRDLGDVSQVLIKVKRGNMIRFIRNEYRLIGGGLFAAAVMPAGAARPEIFRFPSSIKGIHDLLD